MSATTRVTVQVTQEDIDKGKRWDPVLCPVACAFRRAYPAWPEANVSIQGTYTTSDACICENDFGNTLYVRLDHYTTQKIRLFDVTRALTPFEFTVEVPLGDES